MRDNHHYVVDEQSQVPPHLLPPPYLVDIDGHAHPVQYQESLLRLIRPAEQVKVDQSIEEVEDYDDYMKNRLAIVKEKSFGFEWVRQQRVGGVSPNSVGVVGGGGSTRSASADGIKSNDTGDRNVTAAEDLSSQHTVENSKMETSSSGDVHLRTLSEAEVMEDNMNIQDLAGSETKQGHVAAVNGCSSSSLVGHRVEPGIADGSSTRSSCKSAFSDKDNQTAEEEPSHEPALQNLRRSGGGGEERGQDDDGVSHVEDDAGRTRRRGASQDEGVRQDEGARKDGGARQDEGEANHVEVDVVEEASQSELQNVHNMLSSLVYSLGLNEMETKRLVSLWHNRVIIPPLGHAQLSHELAKRQQLFQEEEQNFELETQKALLRDEQVHLICEVIRTVYLIPCTSCLVIHSLFPRPSLSTSSSSLPLLLSVIPPPLATYLHVLLFHPPTSSHPLPLLSSLRPRLYW